VSRTPAAVVVDRRHLTRVQCRLVGDGVPLAWLLDVPTDAPYAVAAHLLAASDGLTGQRRAELSVRPHAPATREDRTALYAAAERVAGRAVPGVTGPGDDSWAGLVQRLGAALDLPSAVPVGDGT
jgi:hypothetical protein